MTAKKVWGVIIIVLGVLCILGGARDYNDTLDLERGLYSIDQMTKQMIGKSNSARFGLNKYIDANQKMTGELLNDLRQRSILSILLGISLSIFGTYLLNDPTEEKSKYSPDGIRDKTKGFFDQGDNFKATDDFVQGIEREISPIDSGEKNFDLNDSKDEKLKTGKGELEEEKKGWMQPDDIVIRTDPQAKEVLYQTKETPGNDLRFVPPGGKK